MALERAFRAFQGARPNGDAGCFRAAWMHGTNKRTSGNYLLLIQQNRQQRRSPTCGRNLHFVWPVRRRHGGSRQ